MEASAVPKAQEVRVVLPDGDTELRLAKFDNAAGCLVLAQIPDDDCEEEPGEAKVKFSSIGDTSVSGKILKLHAGGANGPVLLELHFGHQKFAQDWARAVKKTKQARSSSLPSSPTGTPGKTSPKNSRRGDESMTVPQAHAATTRTLQELCSQQKEQARLLEEITNRKSEQLLKMQERLEEALDMLQVGQATYAKQQPLIDENGKTIERLKDQLKAAVSVEAECNANARAAAAGFAAAKAERSHQSKSHSTSLGARTVAALASGGQGAVERKDDSNENADLLNKLQAIQAEKSEFEAQLQSEQGQIFEQLEELQRMMAELGLEGLSGSGAA